MAPLAQRPDLDDLEPWDLPEPPRSALRRAPWWAWIVVGGIVIILGMVFAGQYNADRFYLECSGSSAEGHRGRSFPPWGHSAIKDARYRSVPLGADAQCQSQEMGGEDELQSALLQLTLTELKRLTLLSGEEELSTARRLVGQGFMLARGEKKARKKLEALRAALDFQQGQVVMRELQTTLLRARRLFQQVKVHQTPHTKEVDAWIKLVDLLLAKLRLRLAGDPTTPSPTPVPPPTRVGPKPVAPSKAPATPDPPAVRVDAAAPLPTPPSMTPPPRRVEPPAPDAGVSSGGILL